MPMDPSCQPGPGSMIVQIQTVDGTGTPTGTILGSGTVLAGNFAPWSGNWVDVPLTQPASVSAGTPYALVVTSEQGGGSYNWSEVPDAYSGGNAMARPQYGTWVQMTAYDFAFKTYVASAQGTATVPGAPQNLVAQAGENGTLIVTWAPPSSDGGSPITGYTIVPMYGNSGSDVPPVTVGANVTTKTLNGIVNGQPVMNHVLVYATNAIGDGPAADSAGPDCLSGESCTFVTLGFQPNLLINGGFLDGTNGWELFCQTWESSGGFLWDLSHCGNFYTTSSAGLTLDASVTPYDAPYISADQTVAAPASSILQGTVTVHSMATCNTDGAVSVDAILLDANQNSLGEILFSHHPYTTGCTPFSYSNSPTFYWQDMTSWVPGTGPQNFTMDIGWIIEQHLPGVNPAQVAFIRIRLVNYADFTRPIVTFGNLSLITPIVNHPPVANAQTVPSFNEDTSVAITLTGSDPDGDPLTFTVVTPPAQGTLTGKAPNLTYTPAENYNGSDSFTFKVNDGTVDSDTATVSLKITPVNDAPILSIQNQSVDEGQPLKFTVSAIDPEGDLLTYSASNLPGGATLNLTTGEFSWKPGYDQANIYTVIFEVSDNATPPMKASQEITITVNNVNGAPVAIAQTVTTPEDTSVAITLTGSDPEKDPLTFGFTQPTHGILTGEAPNLTYTPAENYNGSDSFTFKVNDGTVNSNTATVSLNITPVNDAPILSIQNQSVDEGELLNFTVSATDPEGDLLTYSASNLPGGATLNLTTGEFSWTPDFGKAGSYFVSFVVSDGKLTTSVTITITVYKKEADLSLTLTDIPDPAGVGQELTYTVTVTNNGPSTATGMIVTDTLSEKVSWDSTTSSQGWCSGTSTITCSLGDLASQGSATVTIVVRPTTSGEIKNTAEAKGKEFDPTTPNWKEITTTVLPKPAADLSVTQIGPTTVAVGQKLIYTVTVTNNGPSMATGVIVTNSLQGAPQASSPSITPSQGDCDGSGTCFLGNLASQGSATVTIVRTPIMQGVVGNTARVRGDGGDEMDRNRGNNVNTFTTRVSK
ncbi:MAG: tandem-95 repeat protein [Nitrospinae bacterium]|nr:tandem-95 repeat protein [Nitrospinota bacterium]